MDFFENTRAAGDALPGLIWLVIFAVYAVGRVFEAISKKKQRSGTPDGESAAPGTPSNQLDLKEFIEAITGQALSEESDPDPSPARPTRRNDRAPTSPIPPVPARSTRRTADVQQPSPRRLIAPIPATQIAPRLREIGAADSREAGELGHRRSALAGHLVSDQYLLISSQAIRLAMPSMRLPDVEHQARAKHHYTIPDAKSLRRAMIDRFVLGPPQSLVDYTKNNT